MFLINDYFIPYQAGTYWEVLKKKAVVDKYVSFQGVPRGHPDS